MAIIKSEANAVAGKEYVDFFFFKSFILLDPRQDLLLLWFCLCLPVCLCAKYLKDHWAN